MNTKPDILPALPEGAVYLGRGGSFHNLLPKRFSGWIVSDIDYLWQPAKILDGDENETFYAAPKDSKIAMLNGYKAEMPDLDEEGCDLMKQQAVVLGTEIELVRIREENTALKLRLSEAVRLGDLLEDAARSGDFTTRSDYAEKEKAVRAWEAFKASSVPRGTDS